MAGKLDVRMHESFAEIGLGQCTSLFIDDRHFQFLLDIQLGLHCFLQALLCEAKLAFCINIALCPRVIPKFLCVISKLMLRAASAYIQLRF